MTNVSWTTFEDSNADSFNVYRAVTGLVVAYPNSLVIGDQFIFAATSPAVQKITLTAVDIDSVIATLNTKGLGIKASKNLAGDTLFIRCTARLHAKLKLYPCPFLTNTGQTVRIITPRLEFSLIGNVLAVAPSADYSFSDVDGDPLDWYHVTELNIGGETIPSIDQKPLIAPEDLCVVEGRVIDSQNDPIVGARVGASTIGTVEVSDNSGIVSAELVTLTDELGRWSLPILKGKTILFQIPTIGYNHVVVIPSEDFALFENLVPINDYYFSPSGDPQGGI